MMMTMLVMMAQTVPMAMADLLQCSAEVECW